MAALLVVPLEEDGASFFAGAGFDSDFESDFDSEEDEVDDESDDVDLSVDAATVDGDFASDRLSVR